MPFHSSSHEKHKVVQLVSYVNVILILGDTKEVNEILNQLKKKYEAKN